MCVLQSLLLPFFFHRATITAHSQSSGTFLYDHAIFNNFMSHLTFMPLQIFTASVRISSMLCDFLLKCLHFCKWLMKQFEMQNAMHNKSELRKVRLQLNSETDASF